MDATKNNSLIQWPSAKYWTKQWNPIIGCKPCSPACEHCYAAAWAKRFGQSFEPHVTRQKPPRSGIVFCGNMTDLWGEWMFPCETDNLHHVNPAKLIAWANYRMKDGALYLWLTKRVHRMCQSLAYASAIYGKFNPNHHYFGFTAENQEWYDRRLSEWTKPWTSPLRHINGWLSCEPLLGPIDLHFYTYWNIPKWLVVGCESGPNRRPCNIEWVESIVEQCMDVKIPVFVKQLDIGGKCVTDITKFPKHLQIRQVPWKT